MGRIRTLYWFKVRQFFGPLFHSAGAIVLIALLAVTSLPGIAVFGYYLPDTPIWTSPRLPEILAAALSAFLAFDLMFALSGGTMTHPTEIDFFATSRLRPREYLVADLLFQFTLTDAIAIPALLLGGAGLAARIGWAPVVGALLAFVALATCGLALGQAVGLAVSAHRRYARTVLVLLVVLFLLPAGNLVWPALPTYGQVPLPTSVVGYLIAGLLRGASAAALAGLALVLALFGLAIGGAWYLQGGTDIFPNLRPTMRVAFGQMDMSRQVAKQRAMTQGLSGLTGRFTVDLLKGGVMGMMTRLHLTRIVRDGSVIMVGIFGFMFILIGAANRAASSSGSPELDVLTTGWVALILPLVLAFNWNATERANLWTVSMSPRHLGTYFRGLYRAFLVVTIGVALVAALVSAPFTALGVLAVVVMSFAACGISVILMELLKIPTDAFSLKSAVPFLVVPLLSIASGAPVLLLSLFAGSLGPAVFPIAGAYAVFIVLLFDRLPARATGNFEL